MISGFPSAPTAATRIRVGPAIGPSSTAVTWLRGTGVGVSVGAARDHTEMDLLGPLLGALASAADLLTAAYRATYASLRGRDDAAPGLVALATWLGGTLGTLSVMGLVAFAWDAMLWALRRRVRALLHRATLGADLRLARSLVDHYVRLDRITSLLRRLSGLRSQPRSRDSPDAVTQPGRGTRASRLVLLAPSIVRGLLAAVRSVFTTVWGLLTLAATWWAMGCPGAKPLREWVLDGQRSSSALFTAAGISTVGLAVAVLTFVLGRLRGPMAIGRQAWRREEASQACDELADRGVAVREALARLGAAQWAVHSSWESALRHFDDAATLAMATAEVQLRQILMLPSKPPRPPLRRWNPRIPTGRDPRERAVNQAGEALQGLRDYLAGVTDRRENRVCREVPWRVVQFVARWSLRGAVSKVDGYVTPFHRDPDLTPATHYARCLAARWSIALAFEPLPDGFDFAVIPQAQRLAAVERARQEWADEIDRSKRDFETAVHEIVIEGLIGLVELQTADDRIHAYLHPTGPLTKFLERLRPA